MYVTAMALAEWGTQLTILIVVAIIVHYRNDLGVIFSFARIATGHYIERQKVKGQYDC